MMMIDRGRPMISVERRDRAIRWLIIQSILRSGRLIVTDNLIADIVDIKLYDDNYGVW